MKISVLVFVLVAVFVQVQGIENEEDMSQVEDNTKKEEYTEESDYEAEETAAKKSTNQYLFDSKLQALVTQLLKDLGPFRMSADLRCRTALLYLESRWNRTTLQERKDRTTALKAVVANFQKIANVKNAPYDAFNAVLSLMQTLKPLSKTDGQIVSIPAMLITSFMNLLGENSVNSVTVKVLAENQISRYQSLKTKYQANVASALQGFENMKNYVNSKGDSSSVQKIPSNDVVSYVNKVKTELAKIHGFMAKLSAEISKMKTANDPSNAKNCLKYVELYTKLQILRELLMTHALSLIPESKKLTAIAFYQDMDNLKQNTQHMIQFIHDLNVRNKIMPYFDGNVYRVTNIYLIKRLNVARPDDFPGKYCIKRKKGSQYGWFLKSGMTHPKFGTGSHTCAWRIASHGQSLYSIMSRYNCPSDTWCGSLLSFDPGQSGGKTYVTVEKNDPVLWKISRSSDLSNPGYTIIPKRFCGTKCNMYLDHALEPPPTSNNNKPQPTLNVGVLKSTSIIRSWEVTKAPSSDMVLGNNESSPIDLTSEQSQADTDQDDMEAAEEEADQNNEVNTTSDEHQTDEGEAGQETEEQNNPDLSV